MSSIVTSASVFNIINDEKLVALPMYSSFRRVATSSIRRFSVVTNSGIQTHSSSAQIRSEYRFTPYSVKYYGTAEWL